MDVQAIERLIIDINHSMDFGLTANPTLNMKS